ncbi:copper resistance protein CopC [Streptomyces sporangiiformans]|uniref:Protein YobA n=1 Tax=Streptomyces sporangiiformans TaxID=2315329 RepID=A0A505D8F0_9ACTN|nr:copper resistance protein CopC [Streptomyces sporangiiformans]TPQ18880.1 transporter [Streptomyces sporangiiformans]
MSAPRRAVALVVLLGTLFLLGGAGTASAHSALRDTDPREDSVVKTAPKQVTLTFTESVGLSDDSIRVLDPENRDVSVGEAAHAAGRSDTARVRLRDDLPDGTFTVAWRVVSADSHPIAGAFTFSVGKPSATAAVPVGPAVNPATGVLYGIARYAAYAAAALLIGAATFLLACRPPSAEPLRKPFRIGCWTLLASTVALLFLRGPYARGTGPTSAFDPSLLQNTMDSRPGWALLARLILLGAVTVFLVRLGRSEHRPQERPKPAVLVSGALLAVALAGTWAAAEHASAGIQVPVAMTSSVLHLLAMAVWLGGLAALLITLHRPEIPLLAAPVARFSRLAFTSVAVLVATGVYQSWRGLGSWGALAGTQYGRLLVAKVVVVVLLLGAAAYSRQWTTGRLGLGAETQPRVRELETVGAAASAGAGPGGTGDAEEPDDSHEPDESHESSGGPETPARRQELRRSVLTEVVVGVLVLVITTVLTGTEPGRAATETRTDATAAADPPVTSTTVVPFDVGTPGGRGKVQIVLEPGRVGENRIEALVMAADGGVSTVPEIRLTFTLPSQKIGPIDAELTDQGGYWGTDSLNLPLPGTWTMKVTVRTTDIDQVTESKTVKIAP